MRESFTREYGSRVFHSGPCRPLFMHFELNQLSLITRTHCTVPPISRNPALQLSKHCSKTPSAIPEGPFWNSVALQPFSQESRTRASRSHVLHGPPENPDIQDLAPNRSATQSHLLSVCWATDARTEWLSLRAVACSDAVFGVLAGRRRAARWKWHGHHQRTPTRAAHKMQSRPPQHGLTPVSHAVGRPSHGGP